MNTATTQYDEIHDVIIATGADYERIPFEGGYRIDNGDEWLAIGDEFDAETGDVDGYTYAIYEIDADGSDQIIENGGDNNLATAEDVIRRFIA